MRFKDFEIRPPCFLDGHKDQKKWDVVKWCKREKPERIFDLDLGKYKMSDTYCFSVAFLGKCVPLAQGFWNITKKVCVNSF